MPRVTEDMTDREEGYRPSALTPQKLPKTQVEEAFNRLRF